AFEIDLPRRHEIEAVLGRHRTILDANVPAQLGANLLDDDLAQVQRIADRLLRLRIEKRERRRILAVAEAHGARIVDFLERAGIAYDGRRVGRLGSDRLSRRDGYCRNDQAYQSPRAGSASCAGFDGPRAMRSHRHPSLLSRYSQNARA